MGKTFSWKCKSLIKDMVNDCKAKINLASTQQKKKEI